jgi:hypothetical protein
MAAGPDDPRHAGATRSWGARATRPLLPYTPLVEPSEFALQSRVDGAVVHMTVTGELDVATDAASDVVRRLFHTADLQHLVAG